jgi:hypothetical protein
VEDEATITFRVTDSETGGTALWEDDITVLLTNGFYSAVLGVSEDNPLDTDVLSQAPVWLELQLDGEPAMFPRSPINAVPYATMATVAEEVSGGPVDASQIAVDGTPVVNELGEWVGPAPTVSWTDIEGMPEDFADGVDDDTDTDTDSFAVLGTSCLDGDIPVWDSVLVEWVCGLDAVLTADEVDAIVADNGYAMESEVFSSSFLDLVDVPEGLDDGDSVLTESEVDSMVADNGYAMAADAFSRMWSDLIGIPEDLADGDDVLTEDEVDAMVADNGYALTTELFSGSFLSLSDTPESLFDGDDDQLGMLSCTDGSSVKWNEEAEAWECDEPDEGGSDAVAVNSVELELAPGEALETATETGGIVAQAWVQDDAGGWIPINFPADPSLSGTPCGECGDGSDGAFSSGSVTELTLTSGELQFTSFNVAAEVSISFEGTDAVVIRSQTPVIMNGTLNLQGQASVTTSGGDPWLGGYGGGDGRREGWSGYRCWSGENGGGPGGGEGGKCGTHSGCERSGSSQDGKNGSNSATPSWTSWYYPGSISTADFVGGSGGGGTCHAHSDPSGGGGGGGAIVIVAPSIEMGGTIAVDGGTSPWGGARGSGGSVWLRGAAVAMDGSITGGGILRIDSHELSGDADSTNAIRGGVLGLPAIFHLGLAADGTMSVTNYSSTTRTMRLVTSQ